MSVRGFSDLPGQCRELRHHTGLLVLFSRRPDRVVQLRPRLAVVFCFMQMPDGAQAMRIGILSAPA